jgi:hypothetical protein
MRVRILIPTLLVALAGCSAPRKAGSHNLAIAPEPYVRLLTSNSNLVQLQIASRKFVPHRGRKPAVWLTGVAHLGESNYFAALQEHLDNQQLVLFEGITDRATRNVRGPLEPKPPAASTPEPGHRVSGSDAKLSSLQTTMASSLGLVFQLDGIDYSRSNFRNSDLSVEELRELAANLGETNQPTAGPSLDRLLQMMEGGSFFDSLVQVALRFLGANRKLQGLSKLALIEMIGQINGDPAHMRGLPPSLKKLLEVLIDKRNEKVITDLKRSIEEANAQDSISIFFGTGHMPDMEMRLRRDLNYDPREQVWFTAFTVDLQKAGITQNEWDFIHQFVKKEIGELQTGP